MNKLLIILLCSLSITACSSMNVRPTVGIHAGSSL